MHLLIINGSPRSEKKSNTTTILRAFCQGFEQEGHTTETWYLSDRGQWQAVRQAFAVNEHILFALPLYVENIPGLMLEFLQTLEPKTEPGARLYFLLQSGFSEACQRRCGEEYLRRLPAYLGCEFGGVLSRGNLFAVNLVGEKSRRQMVRPYVEMGRLLAREGGFLGAEAQAFSGPETMTPGQIKMFRTLATPIQGLMFRHMAKKMGCRQPLDAQPYGHLVKGRPGR